MKSLFASLGLAFAVIACSHASSAPATTPAGDLAATQADPEPAVDPTMPSWAPKSCTAYHAEVVRASSCQEIAAATRDSIKQKYDTANESWKAMHDAPQSDIDAIQASCSADAKAVHDEREGKCDVARRP